MVDYDKLLADNKLRYQAGDQSKEEYQKNARTIRRQRRKARAGDTPTKKKASTKSGDKKERRGRKKKVKLNILPTQVEEEVLLALKTAGVILKKELPLGIVHHAFPLSQIREAKIASPEENIGELMINKFKERWLILPEYYAIVMQGNVPVYHLGPIPSEDMKYE